MARSIFLALAVVVLFVGRGCVVSQRCFGDEDCTRGQRCDRTTGNCTTRPQLDLSTPDTGLALVCSRPEMVIVAGRFCVDIWEASRPDATDQSDGVDTSKATSREGVMPWKVDDNATAARACAAADKRLCTPTEWMVACQGLSGTVYSYGDTYDEKTCNGIDSFDDYNFHLAPTGSFARCTNAWGVFDMNGNVWEHTANGSRQTVRGGAFNCADSRKLHRCDYIPGSWQPSAQGFRCCADATAPSDGGVD